MTLNQNLNILAKSEKERERELQKAVVGFNSRGDGFILEYWGDGIHEEIEAINSFNVEDLGMLDGKQPDSGIWIWEGYFVAYQDHFGEWETDTITERWRRPTHEERTLIFEGDNPFFHNPYIEFTCPKCGTIGPQSQCVSCGFSL